MRRWLNRRSSLVLSTPDPEVSIHHLGSRAQMARATDQGRGVDPRTSEDQAPRETRDDAQALRHCSCESEQRADAADQPDDHCDHDTLSRDQKLGELPRLGAELITQVGTQVSHIPHKTTWPIDGAFPRGEVVSHLLPIVGQ